MGQTAAPQQMGRAIDQQFMIQRLNYDLAGEYQAIISYNQYAASVTGPFRRELASFFRTEIPDELGHAQYLAEKIAALGGMPTVEVRPVSTHLDARDMVEQVLHYEEQAVHDYTERVRQAEQFGDLGMANRLQTIVEQETHHLEETRKILEDWPKEAH
jgi:bacterioferritin